MLVALDYDGTFTACPMSWFQIAMMLRANGHRVIGCTMRTPAQHKDMHPKYFEACDEVHFSSFQGKREFLADKSIFPHVWIDDTPEFICRDAADRLLIGPATLSALKRQEREGNENANASRCRAGL